MFKRIFILLTMLFILANVSYAADIARVTETVVSTDSTTLIKVPALGVVRTKAMSMKQLGSSESMGVMYKAEPGTTVSLKIELENGPYLPTTEGEYDFYYVTMDTINASYVDNYWMMSTVDSVMFPYIRFKITGTGSNSNNTRIQMKVAK